MGLTIVYLAACCGVIGYRYQGAGGALAGALLGPFGALCAWVLWTKERAGKG